MARNVGGEPAETMTERGEILAAIAAGNVTLSGHIDESVQALAAITKTNFERIEKRLDPIETAVGEIKTRLDTMETAVGEIKAAVDRLDTKFDRIETRVEDVETRP